MNVEIRTKAIVNVAEMARMCGLSRARFYQLVKEGVFLAPLYRIDTRRPFFTEEMQEVCLEVRRRNCGINGKPIMFYARRHQLVSTTKSKRTPVKKIQTTNKHHGLIEGLKGLGLTTVTASQVEPAVEECFPNGRAETDEGMVLRTVFLHLKRQYSGDKLGR